MPLPFRTIDLPSHVITTERYLRECLLHRGDVYRGQGSIKWGLIPAAFRDKSGQLAQISTRDKRIEYYEDQEFTDHYERLQIAIDARESVKLAASNYKKLQMMAVFQHMGIPTPLLDWTHSPLIALFMAYTFKPSASNVLRIFHYKTSKSPKGIVYQSYKDLGFERIRKQLGGISFFGGIDKSQSNSIRITSSTFEEHCKGISDYSFIEKLDVRVRDRDGETIQKALELNGFTLETMFPYSSYWTGRAITSQLPWVRST